MRRLTLVAIGLDHLVFQCRWYALCQTIERAMWPRLTETERIWTEAQTAIWFGVPEWSELWTR